MAPFKGPLILLEDLGLEVLVFHGFGFRRLGSGGSELLFIGFWGCRAEGLGLWGGLGFWRVLGLGP